MRTNGLLHAVIIAGALLLTTQISFAQDKRGPSTAEERAQAVRTTRALEADPLNKDLIDARIICSKSVIRESWTITLQKS